MAISVDVVISGKTTTSVEGTASSAVVTTNLQEDKLGTKGGIISGSIIPNQNDAIDLGSPSKRFLNLYAKTAHLAADSLKLGDEATISAGPGGGFSFDTEGETVFGDIKVKNLTVTGTQSVISSTNLAIKDNIIIINSGEDGAGITLTSGGLVVDRGTLENATILFNDNTDRFELNFPISVDGSELAIVPNLITTGQTLQGQILTNDTDIANLTTNLNSTGTTLAANLNSTGTTVATNLVTSGQYLTSEVSTLSGLSVFHSMTGNFATHIKDLDDVTLAGNQGKYLKVNSAGDGIAYDIPPVTGVGGEGGGAVKFTGLVDAPNDYSSLQTEFPANGGLVAVNSTSESLVYLNSGVFATDHDLITTGNTLNSQRDALSGDLISTGNALDAARDTLSGNLISTGNNLQSQITSNDSDIASINTNLVSTGNKLDSLRDILSGNLISSGNNLESQIINNDADISTLSGNLITTGTTLTNTIISTGNHLDSLRDTLSGNLISSGNTLNDERDTLSGNLITTGQNLQNDIDTLSGNLISTGNNLQSQITNNDTDISALQLATGEIQNVKFNKAGGTISGEILPNASGTINLGSPSLPFRSGHFDDLIVSSDSIKIGSEATLSSPPEGGIKFDTTGTIAFGDVSIKNLTVTGTRTIVETTDTAIKDNIILLNSGEDGAGITLSSGGLVIDRGSATDANILFNDSTDQFEVNFPLAVEGSLAVKQNQTGIFAEAANLVTTGQTLQTQIISNDGDISTLTSNLASTGNTLTSNVSTLTTNLASTGSTLAADIVTVSGLTQGNDTDLATITSNLATTGQTLTSEISTVSGLVTSNDSDISTLTSNLVTTGQTLQTQITSNDSDISTLTSNLGTTGQTLQTQIISNDSDISTLTSNLATTGQTLQTQITSNDTDISTLTSNITSTGDTLDTKIDTLSGVVTLDSETGNLVDTSMTGSFAVNFLDLDDTPGSLGPVGQSVVVNADRDGLIFSGVSAGGGGGSSTFVGLSDTPGALTASRLLAVNSAGNSVEFLESGTLVTDAETGVFATSANLVTTGQTLTTNTNTVSSNLVSTGSVVDDVSGNLITTGQTLQTQITSNDSDISTLTSNLVTTGQTLTTNINTVATNLGTSGQTLQTQIISNDGDISTLTTNLGTTGQTLQTQITSNDGDITTLTSNLVTTGQTLQTQITSNDSDISTLTSNLGTTGQTLTSEISTLSGLATLDSETGSLIDTSMTGDFADTTILESFTQGLNIGTSNNLASRKLHVVGDIEISGTIYQSGSVFEGGGGGGGGGSSTFVGLSDTPGSFTANKYLSVNSAGNAIEMVDTIQSGYQSVDQGYFTGLTLGGTGTGILQNASGTISNLDLADNKFDVSVIEERDSSVGDAFLSSVELQCTYETNINDESDNAVTATAAGSAARSTSQAKEGSASLDTNGDYVTFPYSADYTKMSSDWTIEAWMYYQNDVGFMCSAGNGVDGWWFQVDGSFIRFQTYGTPALTATETITLSNNTWYHMAAVRNGDDLKVYVNGTSSHGSVTLSAALPNGGNRPLHIGTYSAAGQEHLNRLDAFIDLFRITTAARYTSNFTPPTSFQGNITENKYIGQIGGIDDSDVDYGIEKLSNSQLMIKKLSSNDFTPDRLYVNVNKLGALGKGIAFNEFYTGDGTTTNFAIPSAVDNVRDVLVSVEGLVQIPTTDYTLAGTTGVSFTTAVTSGNLVDIRHLALGPSGAAGSDADASSVSANLITTGQTLTTSINTVSTNLTSTGSVVDDISGNLITTGQTLQTQITSNDSDISTLTSNLITTGQTLTTNINTVSSNLVSTGAVVDDISGNLITSGQTLQTQITSNDGDITTLTSNLITTGQTLTSEIATVSGLIPATVIDGAGTANTVPLWSDANTIGDSVISQSSSKIGIGTNAPATNQTLDVMFADDVNGAGVTFQNSDGSLQFHNVAGSANQFNPQVKGNSKNVANVGLRLLGNAASGEDSGAVPLILLRGTVNNAKATTRPVLHVEDGDGGKLMAVAANGNVGIGIAAPTTKLHISYPAVGQDGSAVTSLTTTTALNLGLKLGFSGGANSNNNIIGGISLGNSGEEFAGMYALDGGASAATDLALFVGTTGGIIEAVKIDSSGSVGIGTNAPASKLHLYSATDANTIVKLQGGSDSAKGAHINFLRGATDVGSFGTKASLIGGTSNDLMFYSASNDFIYYSTAERMRIKADGKVGIGCDPSVDFQVGNSVSGETKVATFNSEGGTEIGLKVKSRTNRAKLAVSDNDTTAYIVAEGGARAFGPNDTAHANNLIVNGDGNVGVGTITPSKKFHVVGDIEISGTIYQSGSVFEGGGGGGGSSTFVGLSDTPGSFTANRVLTVNAAGNAVETTYNTSVLSGHQSVEQGYFTGLTLGGTGTGILQNASGTISSLDLADNKFDVSVIEERDTVVGDANFSDVSLLLPFDGSNGATSTSDSSDSDRTITLNSSVVLSTTQSKFGGTSLYVPGSSSACQIGGDFSFAGDFTIEFWEYIDTRYNDSISIGFNASSTNYVWHSILYGYYNGGTKIKLYSSSNGSSWNIANAVEVGDKLDDQWVHRALVRSGSTWYSFQNGTQYWTADLGSNALNTASQYHWLGRGYNSTSNRTNEGYYDDVRVTLGVARYTSNFTVPSAAFPTAQNITAAKYVGQIGGIDDTDVDYGIEKLSNSQLMIKKLSDNTFTPDRLYVNVNKLGALGHGIAFDQVYTGNGTSDNYLLSENVSNARDVLVSVEGLIQTPIIDYTLAGATGVSFTTNVTSGHEISFRHLALGPSGADGADGASADISYLTERFTGNGVISGFKMTRTISTADEIFVFVNGLVQDSGANFSVTAGTGIYFTSGEIASGDKIMVRHIY